MKKTYARKAIFGFAWMVTGVAIANVFSYFLRLLLVRNLTVHEYGIIYAVIALFHFADIFLHLGLSPAIAKYVAAFSAKDEQRKMKEIIIWAIRLLCTAAFVVCASAFLSADWFGRVYVKNPIGSTLIKIFAISVLLSPFMTIMRAVLQGRQRMSLRSVYEVFHSIILFAATAVFIYLGYGAKGAMYAYVLLHVVMFIAFVPILTKHVLPGFFSTRVSPDFQTVELLLRFGLPVMLTSVAGAVLTHTDTLFLTLFTTVDEVGIYHSALPTAKLLLFLVFVINTVLLPLVAELWEKNEKQLITQMIERMYHYALIVTIPLAIVILVYAPTILSLLFGEQYLPAVPILRILTISSLFLILHAINTATLSGMGMPKANTKAIFLAAGLNVILNIILIPSLGGIGAAISTFLATVILFGYSTWFLRKQLHLRLPFFEWVRVLAGGAAFLSTLWLSKVFFFGIHQYLLAFITVVCGGGIYLCVLVLTRTLTMQDVLMFREQISRRYE